MTEDGEFVNEAQERAQAIAGFNYPDDDPQLGYILVEVRERGNLGDSGWLARMIDGVIGTLSMDASAVVVRPGWRGDAHALYRELTGGGPCCPSCGRPPRCCR